MKRYRVVDKYRLYEFILVVGMIGVLIFYNNVKHNEYKSKGFTQEQEAFIQHWNGIPNELKEIMNVAEEVAVEEEFQVMDIPLSEELQRYVFDMCEKHQMDFTFVLSVMQTESSFRPKAKCKNQSSRGYSLGLMQLNNQYIKWYKELTEDKQFNIWDEKDNIHAGILVLKHYRDYWINQGIEDEDGLWYLTLNSYNCGVEGIKRIYKKTGIVSRSYDRKVLENKLEIEGGIE
jgi:hypothetical protein